MRVVTEKQKIIGERLKKLRGKKAKAEVAEAIGVSESSYVKYERGERNPDDDIKIKIAAYYKRTVGHIFFEGLSTNVNLEESGK